VWVQFPHIQPIPACVWQKSEHDFTMKINDDHMYHGAALTQIAEHPQFTAINAFKHDGTTSRSSFVINTDIGVYLKYATKATKAFNEFPFTFLTPHLEELKKLESHFEKVYLGLVCVAAKQVCAVSYEQFKGLLAARREAKGGDEVGYTVLVTVPAGKSFRVYVNQPGEKKTSLGTIIVSRNTFPGCLFV
jgi:hypothetical protein